MNKMLRAFGLFAVHIFAGTLMFATLGGVALAVYFLNEQIALPDTVSFALRGISYIISLLDILLFLLFLFAEVMRFGKQTHIERVNYLSAEGEE